MDVRELVELCPDLDRANGFRSDESRKRNQLGATLIEILVVMAVMVPVVLAASYGLLLTVKLSSSTNTRQNLEAAATSYSESLKTIPYTNCAEPSDYQGKAGLWTAPAGSGISMEIVGVQYWNQSTRDYSSMNCPTPEADQGTQLVIVKATNSEYSTELEVVKRNPDGSAGGTP